MKLFKKSLTILSMNKMLAMPFLILFVTPVLTTSQPKASGSTPIASLAPATADKYNVDKKESVVTWHGSMVMASKGGHTGYVYLSKGELMIDKGHLVGGRVEVDMTTITEKTHGSDNSLVKHLKDPDFFDVEKFPTTTFDITNVSPGEKGMVNVTGNLTIKGVTNAVIFPATLDVKAGVATAYGTLVIDRTKWDVWFKSGKFLASLTDDLISDNIYFEMKIVARKFE